MLGRVAVWGIIAAADMAASPTEAQMHPPGPDLKALLATIGARRHVDNRSKMNAGIRHEGQLRPTGNWVNAWRTRPSVPHGE